MILRAPTPEELPGLSDMCLRSQASWGYDGKMLNTFRQDLTLNPEELETDALMVAEDKRGVAGMVQLSMNTDTLAQVKKLYVAPNRLGEGTGKMMYVWACRTAQENGAEDLLIVSDPQAAGFYEHMGAVLIEKTEPSPIPGRTLPCLIHKLRAQA
ncbi:GNAT family N-acetyltransferase [Hyphomonas pacifica]|uniref:GNAT family N-acetyltransferase n=1 Tax=Hyphomonas pacifica TaxID=1280941 RepID=UPI000DBFE509|nr:GNAT family N-acetyltransferase [Hyphomonas pacifica]RAN36393.1 hypothetical protein HY11_01335 [Hyphomonas pacifica]